MIRLDQIKNLESKVNRAVEQIRLLREENMALKRTVEKSQARMGELEGLVSRFKSDQDEIEQGILRALKNLDKLEDEVTTRAGRKESAAPAVAPSSPAPAAAAAPAHSKAPAAAPEPLAEAEPPEEPVVDTGEDDPEPATGEQLDIF
jgi:septal ring factor EnvC (AmiA/AmiB activator)